MNSAGGGDARRQPTALNARMGERANMEMDYG
jgi:hypothetical protein